MGTTKTLIIQILIFYTKLNLYTEKINKCTYKHKIKGLYPDEQKAVHKSIMCILYI